MDGKTLSGTLHPIVRAAHLLAVVDHQTGCVLSQCRVDEQTNESITALELLRNMVLEGRTLTSTTVLNDYLDWPGLQEVCRIDRARRIRRRGERETVYDITSLPRTLAGPEDLLRLASYHWGVIENRLHSVRDEALGEDRSTIVRGHAPQNRPHCATHL